MRRTTFGAGPGRCRAPRAGRCPSRRRRPPPPPTQCAAMRGCQQFVDRPTQVCPAVAVDHLGVGPCQGPPRTSGAPARRCQPGQLGREGEYLRPKTTLPQRRRPHQVWVDRRIRLHRAADVTHQHQPAARTAGPGQASSTGSPTGGAGAAQRRAQVDALLPAWCGSARMLRRVGQCAALCSARSRSGAGPASSNCSNGSSARATMRLGSVSGMAVASSAVLAAWIDGGRVVHGGPRTVARLVPVTRPGPRRRPHPAAP